MSHPNYTWHRLPNNGPRLALASLPDSECAALSIHIPAGSRDESAWPSGIAHFVEHMVFKGTERRSARDLSLEIESAGGQINACTSEDQTIYEGRGEAELLPQLADVMADMVWHATFPAAEITLEREVIHEEITMYREAPADHIGDLISKALWGEHPLGHPISGTHESIRKINRKLLLEWRHQHYFRNDLVIAVAGPYDLNSVTAMLAPMLPELSSPPAARPPFEHADACSRHVCERRDTDQLQLSLAWHTPGRKSPTRHGLRLLSMMLGETASSRLFLELREERGLCYQIGSDVTLFDDTGAFEINLGLDPDARDEAIACIEHEIADLARHGPRHGELDRAQRLVIAHAKFAFEATSAHASWAGECLMDWGRIPDLAEWRNEILAVTNTQIQQLAHNLASGPPPARAEIGPPHHHSSPSKLRTPRPQAT